MLCSTDPIADFLTRIRNGLAVGQSEVSAPYSRLKRQLAELLVKNGYLLAVDVDGQAPKQTLRLQLSSPAKPPILVSLERVSKPGRRVYVGHQSIPRVKNGRGLLVLSTSRGLLTDRTARRAKIGGEIICRVY